MYTICSTLFLVPRPVDTCQGDRSATWRLVLAQLYRECGYGTDSTNDNQMTMEGTDGHASICGRLP